MIGNWKKILKNKNLKYYLKVILFYLGVFSMIRVLFPRKGLAVLRYHAVCAPHCDYASPGICVTPEAFTKQIRYLRKKYMILRLEDAIEKIGKGEPVPNNAISITFDDGYQDNFSAFKILNKLKATATFFITTNCIDDKEIFWVAEIRFLINRTCLRKFLLNINDRFEEFVIGSKKEREEAISKITGYIKSTSIPNREVIRKNLRSTLNDVDSTFKNNPLMLTKTQIREMIDGGMSIGGHTVTHCNLPNAGIEASKIEIKKCKSDLEYLFELEISTFAYPNGGAEIYYTEENLRQIEEAGFKSAYTSEPGFINNNTDFRKCPRFPVTDSLPELIFLLEGDRMRSGRKIA